MTTATSNKNGTLEPDTKPDADTTVDVKADTKVSEAKNPLNTTNILLGIAVAVIFMLSGYTALAVRAAQTETRSIETAAKVERLEPVVSKVSTIEVKMGYVESSVNRIEQKIDKALEARK
jgi:hypothetical protein